MIDRPRRPCLYCGEPTRSKWQACDQHLDLLAEDYKYVRELLLDGPTASQLRSRAMQAAPEREDVSPAAGTEP